MERNLPVVCRTPLMWQIGDRSGYACRFASQVSSKRLVNNEGLYFLVSDLRGLKMITLAAVSSKRNCRLPASGVSPVPVGGSMYV